MFFGTTRSEGTRSALSPHKNKKIKTLIEPLFLSPSFYEINPEVLISGREEEIISPFFLFFFDAYPKMERLVLTSSFISSKKCLL